MTKPKIKETIALLTDAINDLESGGLPNAPAGTRDKLFDARAALATTVHPRGSFNRYVEGNAASRRIKDSLSTKPGI